MAIQFVGSAFIASAASASVALTTVPLTALQGGIAPALSAGDVSLAFGVVASNTPRGLALSEPGYTVHSNLGSNTPDRDVYLARGYKVQGATPDAQAAFTITSSASSSSQLFGVAGFRGVDAITPLDIGPASAVGTFAAAFDPPSVTPITPAAWIVVAAAAGHGDTANPATPIASSDLTTLLSVARFGSFASGALFIGYKEWTAGTFDPAPLILARDLTSEGWAVNVYVLRPAAESGPPPATGTGSGDLVMGGSGAGSAQVAGSASGSLVIAGSAAGQALASGASNGGLPLGGTGAGTAASAGQGGGFLDLAGSGQGATPVTGTGAGALPLTGSGIGASIAPDASPRPGLVRTGALIHRVRSGALAVRTRAGVIPRRHRKGYLP